VGWDITEEKREDQRRGGGCSFLRGSISHGDTAVPTPKMGRGQGKVPRERFRTGGGRVFSV